MEKLFIETKYIYSKELEGYVNMDETKIKRELNCGSTIYGDRFFVQGILISIPNIISRVFFKHYPRQQFIGVNAILFKPLKRKKPTFNIK